MAAPRHPWRLAGLLLLASLGFGCNMLALPFFLMTGMDPKHEARCKLACDDKKKEVRVVIVAYSGLETRPEFIRVDSELTHLLSRHLQEAFRANKEKVTVVSRSQVDKYKDEHPNWHALSAAEIGRYFNADYVIDLEINALSLYERGSSNQLYRGHADITISCWDVNASGEDPKYTEPYTAEYPRTRGPIAVSDGNAQQFRQAFLNQVAKELSWRFSAHPTSDDYTCTD